jgi:protocatechuate 3,4-dioxygenase beta subunit
MTHEERSPAAGKEVLATPENIEGPFYRPEAPFRTRLCEASEKGQKIVLQGQILAPDGSPIRDAVLDVWHASAFGHYDNDNPDTPPPEGEFRLRGRIATEKEGKYRLESVRPGHYKITPTVFRPAHIHFKVYAPGFQTLTSQFFFKGEKYNKIDPWFMPSMVLDMKPQGNVFVAHYTIVLAEG